MEAFVTIGNPEELQTGPSVPKPEVKTLELDETYGKFALEPFFELISEVHFRICKFEVHNSLCLIFKLAGRVEKITYV